MCISRGGLGVTEGEVEGDDEMGPIDGKLDGLTEGESLVGDMEGPVVGFLNLKTN